MRNPWQKNNSLNRYGCLNSHRKKKGHEMNHGIFGTDVGIRKRKGRISD